MNSIRTETFKYKTFYFVERFLHGIIILGYVIGGLPDDNDGVIRIMGGYVLKRRTYPIPRILEHATLFISNREFGKHAPFEHSKNRGKML